MSREKWLAHLAEEGLAPVNGENLARAREHAFSCATCAKRRATRRANKRRRERAETLRSLGLVKVRGALGGTYWE